MKARIIMDLKQLIEELTEVKNRYGNMQIVMDENSKQKIIKVKVNKRKTICILSQYY